MKFKLHIKSPIDAPDYEDEVFAENKEQAAELFADRVSQNDLFFFWTPDEVKKHITQKE